MKPNRPARPFLRLVEEPEDFALGAWRDDQNLVLTHQATLPDKCVLCNSPAENSTIKKTLIWHTPFILPLLVFFPIGLVFYVPLALLFKKTMQINLPICAQHRRRRLGLTTLGLIMLPALPVLAAIGISISEPILVPPGILLSILGLIVLIFGRNEVWPLRIDDNYAHIRGASPEWLSALPIWVEPDPDVRTPTPKN